jgi:hypothetical protein
MAEFISHLPSMADWQRADIIAALALAVSVLAFLASAASSLVSWKNYKATRADAKPKVTMYFEPFEDSNEWWIAHFELRNRSSESVSLESIEVNAPWRARFSTYFGPYVGSASGGGPTHYSIPEEVLSEPAARLITSAMIEENHPIEFAPSKVRVRLQTAIIKIPTFSFHRFASFKVKLRSYGEFPALTSFKAGAPTPTPKNTKPRY